MRMMATISEIRTSQKGRPPALAGWGARGWRPKAATLWRAATIKIG